MAGRPAKEADASTFHGRVGNVIRTRRERMKRTAAEAAQAAGIPLRTWYAFEQGRSLNIEQLPRIAKALNCKVRLLLPDE